MPLARRPMQTASGKRRRPEDSGAASSGDTVVVGRITGAYGIRGDVRLQSFTSPASNMLDYQPWLIVEAGQWRPLECRRVRAHRDGFVAHIADVDDRDHAEALKGREIGVPAAALPATEADEYYWRDLIGLDVVTADGRLLGTVEWLLDTGRHDTLVIRPADGGRDILIPFAAAYVTRVDVDSGRLIADWQGETMS